MRHVRIHADADAAQAAQAMHAKAFTVGPDIVFGAGQFAPGTTDGMRLLAHELTHTVQQQSGSLRIARQPPAGYIETVDPDVPVVPDPNAPRPSDNELLPSTHRDFPFVVAYEDPAEFVVPEEATREDIAARLMGDPTLATLVEMGSSRTLLLGLVQPGRSIRLRDYSRLEAEPYRVLRESMDRAVERDVQWTVDRLSERTIPASEEAALVEMALKWSQRSIIVDAAGTQYFDRYLNGLDGRVLVSFWGTRKTALEWLLEEVPSRRELVQKAIELRSSWTVGYSVTDQRPEFRAGDVIGRFFYSAGKRSKADSVQLKVQDTVANEESMDRAERVTRNTHHGLMRVVVPGSDGRFYGYTIRVQYPMPTGKYSMPPPNPLEDAGGEYYWYYPGTVFIRPGEFQVEFAAGTEADREHRRTLLSAALDQASPDNLTPILRLDFDVLSTATLDERLRLMNYVLDGTGRKSESGVALVSRVILSTPNTSFHALERCMSTDGTLAKFFEVSRFFPGLAVIGRAFTLKALEAMPLALPSFRAIETFKLGEDASGVYHFAFSDRQRTRSQVVPEAEWQPGMTPRPGSEPGVAGEAGGAIERDVIRFQPAILREGMSDLIIQMFGGDPVVENNGPLSREFLPTELVQIEIIGAAPQTLFVTALEAAGMLDLSFSEYTRRVIMPAANINLWAMALGGLVAGFGPAVAGGAMSGGMRGALQAVAGQAVSQAGRQAIARFAYEAALLGSMQIVDAHRDELMQSEAGRNFLALYDVVMIALVARDIHRVLSSGAIARLGRLGLEAIQATTAASRAALRRTVDEIRALAVAWKRLGEAGELVPAGVPGVFRPRDPAVLQQTWMAARAEVFSGSLMATLREAGASTTTAERVMNRLQSLAERSTEMGRATAALARRSMALAPAEVERVLLAVERTLGNARGLNTELGGWLGAAARASDPVAYLAQVDILIARRGVGKEAIEVLGNKAAADVLDLDWLNQTALTDRDLSFLGRDPNTPWDLFRRVAVGEGDDLIALVRSRIRGASAELVAQRNFSRLLPNYSLRGSQVPMNGSTIDFEVVESRLGRRRGLEIKGWTPETWSDALAAYEARAAGLTLSSAQRQAIRKLDHMVGQLRNAQSFTGNAPILGMTDGLQAAEEATIQRLLRAEGLGGTRLVKLSDADIVEMGRKLRAALSLP